MKTVLMKRIADASALLVVLLRPLRIILAGKDPPREIFCLDDKHTELGYHHVVDLRRPLAIRSWQIEIMIASVDRRVQLIEAGHLRHSLTHPSFDPTLLRFDVGDRDQHCQQQPEGRS